MLHAALDYWRARSESEEPRFASIIFPPTKFSARSVPEGLLPRGHALRAEFALFGLEGGIRPSGARLAHTYGLPILITNCSNNYGPYHFPEKLIPLMILNALEGKPLPVYGKGENVRDWLFVEDHAEALLLVAQAGVLGESYNIGGRSERRNIDVVEAICDLVDELPAPPTARRRRDLIALRARSSGPRSALRDRQLEDRA